MKQTPLFRNSAAIISSLTKFLLGKITSAMSHNFSTMLCVFPSITQAQGKTDVILALPGGMSYSSMRRKTSGAPRTCAGAKTSDKLPIGFRWFLPVSWELSALS